MAITRLFEIFFPLISIINSFTKHSSTTRNKGTYSNFILQIIQFIISGSNRKNAKSNLLPSALYLFHLAMRYIIENISFNHFHNYVPPQKFYYIKANTFEAVCTSNKYYHNTNYKTITILLVVKPFVYSLLLQ